MPVESGASKVVGCNLTLYRHQDHQEAGHVAARIWLLALRRELACDIYHVTPNYVLMARELVRPLKVILSFMINLVI